MGMQTPYARRSPANRVLSTIVLIIGMLAVVATSDDIASFQDEHQGRSFTISASNAEIRIPYTFSTSQPTEDADLVTSQFQFQIVWRGVPSEARLLEYSVDGAALETWGSNSNTLGISCDTDCVGNHEVLIRWPSDVDRGSASVEWSVRVGAQFEDTPPPDDFQVSLDVEDGELSDTGRIIQEGTFGSDEPHEPGITKHTFELASSDPDAEVWLEIPSGWPPLLVTEGESQTALSAGDSLQLPPPPGCPIPCSWTVETTINDHQGRSSMSWRLRHIGGSSDAIEATSPVSSPAPSIKSGLSGHESNLSGDDFIWVPLRIELNDTALDVEDFEDQPLYLLLSLEVTVDEAASQVPEVDGAFPSLGVRLEPIESPLGASPGTVFLTISPDDFGEPQQLTRAASITCNPNFCGVSTDLIFEPNEMTDGQVTFDWTLLATLQYPLAGRAPLGALIDAERLR